MRSSAATIIIDVGVAFADHERAQLTERSSCATGSCPRSASASCRGRRRRGRSTGSEHARDRAIGAARGEHRSGRKQPGSAAAAARPNGGESPTDEGGDEMEANEIRQAVTDAVTPLGGAARGDREGARRAGAGAGARRRAHHRGSRRAGGPLAQGARVQRSAHAARDRGRATRRPRPRSANMLSRERLPADRGRNAADHAGRPRVEVLRPGWAG